jgi:SAM-dependent methyltransferase
MRPKTILSPSESLVKRSRQYCVRSFRYRCPMATYREQVLPWLIDRALGTTGFRHWRAETTSGLSGTVLEIGFGSGLNVDHYPTAITRVMAVEPSSVAFRLAGERIHRSPIPVEQVGLDGQSIPLPDDSCDSALCTFTLCTIPDADAALTEVRRILRPGGRFHFLEHGLSPDVGVAKWQRRLDPVQGRVAGGCHVTRDPVALVKDAGFLIEDLVQRYGKGPKPWSYFTRAVARNAAH